MRAAHVNPGGVVLVAHGSTDPRAAYLDHTRPRPAEVLASFDAAGAPDATVVPLLLTAAYHNRVDLPAMLAEARAHGLRLPVRVTEVLGPVGGVVPAPLLAGLRRRLLEATGRFDAVVLAAAGTGDATARGTVEESALALGEMLRVPCRVGYASAAPPLPGQVVAELRDGGARRVAVAAYFLATGLLYRVAAESALAAGATAVAAPLGDARELAHLVLARIDAAQKLHSKTPRDPGRRAGLFENVRMSARGA